MTELSIAASGVDLWCPDTERDLVERAKHDSGAFALLYRQHYRAIAGYVFRRVGNEHAADDLVAEVFLTALRSLHRFRHRGVPIRAWLFRIATNTVNRWAKKQRRRWGTVSLDDEIEAPVTKRSCAEAKISSKAKSAQHAMLSLSPKHQAVLSLHYLEEMSLEDVATVLGCRLGTVKSRLSRAREALRERLNRRRSSRAPS